MTTLKELTLAVTRLASGGYFIDATLREQTPYPPRFVPAPFGGVQAESTSHTRASTNGVLPADALVEVPGFRRAPSLFFFDAPPWRGLSVMPEGVRWLLIEFYREAYRDLKASHRLVVQSVDPEVLAFPWQAFLPPTDGFHGERIAFLARLPQPPSNPVPFRLPLTLGIHGGLARGRELFEAFTLDAIAAGSFEVRDPRGTGEQGELVHLEEGVRVFPYGPRAGWPRLAVLHVNDEAVVAGRPVFSPVSVNSLLEHGVGAALLVSGPSSKCQAFFPAFYRKLLHNVPLEECVREALLRSGLRLGTDLDVLLGVREGGEYGLLLSQGTAELEARLPWSRRGGLESFTTPLTSLKTPRALEIASTLDAPLRRLEATAERAAQQALSSLGGLSSRQFNEEAHDLRLAVTTFRDLQQARQGGETLASLEAMSEEEFQGGLNRLLNVSLGRASGGASLDKAPPLMAGDSVSLHVQIAPARLSEAFATAFPEALLAEAFASQEQVELDVCVFHDGKSARVARSRGTLSLPRHGPSTDFSTLLHLEKPGLCRLRVGIYHRNTLLQSVAIEAWVADPAASRKDTPAEQPPIQYALDYVASPDLLLLEEHARPALNLVTNRAADGNLWIGVFSDRESGQGGLRAGSLHSFPPGQLATLIDKLREALQQAQGTAVHRYTAPLNASNREERARQLVQLAVQGWRLYDTLFNSNLALSDEEKEAFDVGLEAPGTISIARCALEEASIPWAALYDRPLDLGGAKPPTLCPVFLEQLAAGSDLLDEPSTCRALATCPLQTEAARHTVCPFGFWGIRHQLEQPLKQLRAETSEDAAEQLTNAAFAESSRLPSSDKPPSALMGYGSNIPGITAHSAELEQLPGWRLLSSADRDAVVKGLERGPANLFYIFCHGVIQDDVFKLQLPPATIEAADLQPMRGRSPFLVFLNACDSMATLPEVINQLLGKLTRMGALAVIGSEIKINNLFARPFARQVLIDFLEGRTLGEAFMGARRRFLRSLNPLGLAYTLHSPVNVHLHDGACRRCGSRA